MSKNGALIKACGFLVFRDVPDPSFLLMKHPKRWDLPKGHVDPGESEVETALRELHEETGLNLVKVYRHSPAIFSSAGITDEAIAMARGFGEIEARVRAVREKVDAGKAAALEAKEALVALALLAAD